MLRNAASRFRAWIVRPRAQVLLGVVALVLGAAGYFGGPHLWAWYHFRAAERDLARHRPAPAYEHLTKSLKIWPNSAETQLLAGQAARRAGNLDAARRHLLECQRLESKPSDASVLEWAMFRATSGELDHVESFLRSKIATRHPQSGLIYEALVEGYLLVYRIHHAFGALRDWLNADSDHPVARSLRGRAWQRVHNYINAVADFRRAVEIDPERDEDRFRLADCLIEASNPREAAEHLEILRKRGMEEPRVLIRLAFARNQLGDGDEGIRILDLILAKDPNQPTALAAHAAIDCQAGRHDAAEHYVDRALALNPYDRHAHYTRYLVLAQQESRTAEAKAQHERLKVLEDRLTRLIDVTNRQMPQRPRDPELHYELGTLLAELGHTEQAASWYRSALRLDPAHAKARAALEEQ